MKLAIVLSFFAALLPVAAHHSWPVNMRTLVTVKGTITSVEWSNPPPMFGLEVRTDKGTIEKWAIGGPAITRMEANGWTKTTLSVGDVVTGSGYQFSDGVYEVCEVLDGHLIDERRHIERLQRSLGELRIAMPMTPQALSVVFHEVVRRNRIHWGIVYLQITRGVSRRDHAFPPAGTRPSVVVTARKMNFEAAEKLAGEGIAVIEAIVGPGARRRRFHGPHRTHRPHRRRPPGPRLGTGQDAEHQRQGQHVAEQGRAQQQQGQSAEQRAGAALPQALHSGSTAAHCTDWTCRT